MGVVHASHAIADCRVLTLLRQAALRGARGSEAAGFFSPLSARKAELRLFVSGLFGLGEILRESSIPCLRVSKIVCLPLIFYLGLPRLDLPAANFCIGKTFALPKNSAADTGSMPHSENALGITNVPSFVINQLGFYIRFRDGRIARVANGIVSAIIVMSVRKPWLGDHRSNSLRCRMRTCS